MGKIWSKYGQNMGKIWSKYVVKIWSKDGQNMVKIWSKYGQNMDLSLKGKIFSDYKNARKSIKIEILLFLYAISIFPQILQTFKSFTNPRLIN